MHTISYTSLIFAVSILMAFIFASKPVKGLAHQTPGMNDTIEGMRGIACIFVVINHSAWVLMHNGMQSKGIDYGIFSYFGNFGSFGVEIFFCITGFLFSSKIKKGKFDLSFFEKRIRRLAPAYIVVSTVILILFIMKHGNLIKNTSDISSLILQVYGFGFFGSGIILSGESITSLNAVIWTLPYEWKFYAILPFVSVIFGSKKLLIPSVIFSALFAYTQYIDNNTLWLYFIVGFIGSYIKPTTNNRISLAVSIFALFLLFYSIASSEYQYGFFRTIYVGGFFLLCIYSAPFYLRLSQIKIIGTISYGVYIVHQPVMFVVTNFFNKAFGINDFSLYALLAVDVVSSVVTVMLSGLMYKYLEKRFM